MANIKLTLSTPSGFAAQLAKVLFKGSSSLLITRGQTRISIIQNRIRELLAKTFDSTDVAKSLRTASPVDLPAHFGLNDAQANNLADGMREILSTGIKVTFGTIGYRARIRIDAGDAVWPKYENLPGASYISPASNAIIPVMRWMLIDPSTDFIDAIYDIVFVGTGISALDTNIIQRSRSGRAIMLDITRFGGTGGYVLPSILRDAGAIGRNFIEDALIRPDIAKRIAQIFMEST